MELDEFDLDDAYGEQKEFMCSSDLKEFVEKNNLNLSQDGGFIPRDIFGSIPVSAPMLRVFLRLSCKK